MVPGDAVQMLRSVERQPGFGARAHATSQRLVKAVVASLLIAVASLGVVLLLSLFGAPTDTRLALGPTTPTSSILSLC
ncbi:hypothetical protein [Rhodopseudomonas sp. B29]|uniref:hypothetical protein n=1 Tax=Rhodopseudomonas sp. B29 TaxID=95607 RepID=UPI0003B3F534|nr:hypothetical protein [Rhodopseudomonas sp. B29]